MARPARDPFDIPLDDEHRATLAVFLTQELQSGLDARASNLQDVEYWHQLYEQARTRTGRNAPWPDAADLTSYLPSEKVDAMHARIIKTIRAEPIWTVEGWGEAANKAPFVEEFHQWKAEEERLLNVLDRLILMALIEPRGLLEVAEGTEMRTQRKHLRAKLQTDPLTGGMIYGDDGNPQPELGPDGKYVEAGDQDLAADMVVDSPERIRTGPVYRLLPYRDSVILPGHARDQEDIWAYFKRFFKRYPELQRQADAGVYDADAVAKLNTGTDREQEQSVARSGMTVAPETETTAEKELWEGLVLLDLNAFCESRRLSPLKKAKTYDWERWYLVTLHLPSQQILRFQHDDMERSRYVLVNLFPRPDRATEGFSLVGHKLLTIAEEHTAVRNMKADRSAMAVQAPIKRLQGALWDPFEQPWGPKAVIDVRDMRELEPMVVPDVTAPLIEWEQTIERTAERVVGVNDIASGQVSQQARTLGEVNMATQQSFVRMDLVVGRLNEPLEALAQIRHAIWKRALAEQPDGVDAPSSMTADIEGRGVSIDQYLPGGKITAELLDGAFKFKPHGSVETADIGKERQDWVAALQALQPMLMAFPALQGMLQSPQAGRAMFREWLRLFRVPNKQAFIGSAAQDLQQTLQAQMVGQLPPGLPVTGTPAGMPPPGAAPGAPPPQGGPLVRPVMPHMTMKAAGPPMHMGAPMPPAPGVQ